VTEANRTEEPAAPPKKLTLQDALIIAQLAVLSVVYAVLKDIPAFNRTRNMKTLWQKFKTWLARPLPAADDGETDTTAW
jgi:hypothetical protein